MWRWMVALLLLSPQEGIEDLLLSLRSEKIEERQEAARRLKGLGEAALPRLREAAQDKDLDFALRARDVLRSLTKRKLPEAVAAALGWLPADTETLMVSQGSFSLPIAGPGPEPTLERLLQSLPSWDLPSLEKGHYARLLGERPLVLALQGARHFRSPTGLGMMRYAGCQILVFKEDLGERGEALIAALKESGKASTVEGQAVYRFAETAEKDERIHLLARPRGDVLLCATDEAFLAEVLRRFRAPAAERALPEALPEWEHVDVAAPFWAIRHYDPRQAEKDPSSPLRPKAAANIPDAHAVGMTFFLSRDEKAFVVRYLTSNTEGPALARQLWDRKSEGMEPRSVAWHMKGVVQTLLPDPKDPSMLLFFLLGALGQAVFL